MYGEGHFVTFDGQQYTFNGNGYYTLASLKDQRHTMEVQIRMEQPSKNVCKLNFAV